MRGSLVERARLCSSVVRSAFGRFLCGVRLVLVRVAFVRGGRSRGGSQGGSQRRQIVEVKHKAADTTRAHHGRITDFTRTGDGRASVRLGRIQLSQDGRRRAVGGLATDGNGHATGYTRTIPLRTDNGRQTDRQRTSDGRRTGGHLSVADILRHSEMGGGAAADLPRTGNGHATGLSQTIPLRTCNGRHTGLPTGF